LPLLPSSPLLFLLLLSLFVPLLYLPLLSSLSKMG
jgi:hypothetical protein